MLLGGYQGSSSDLLVLLVLSTWATPASSMTLDLPLLPSQGSSRDWSVFLKHFLSFFFPCIKLKLLSSVHLSFHQRNLLSPLRQTPCSTGLSFSCPLTLRVGCVHDCDARGTAISMSAETAGDCLPRAWGCV